MLGSTEKLSYDDDHDDHDHYDDDDDDDDDDGEMRQKYGDKRVCPRQSQIFTF